MAWLREIGLGHHREFEQRIGFDKLDRVMEHTKSDGEVIEDDHREQSSGHLEEQRDRRESHPVGAENDLSNTQRD